MKPAAFDYCRAKDAAEAMALYARAGGDAVYLAGGQSLIPAMAMRLNEPAALIDIGRLPELQGIAFGPSGLRIGALTPHAGLLSDPLIARHAPLLREAARFIAHPAIRNRATLGGNLTLADPASELPAAMVALDAVFEILTPDGPRKVAAEDFFLDLFTTALEPGELLCAVHIAVPRPGARFAFQQYARRQGDFALAGVAVQLVSGSGLIQSARICFHAVGATPLRARGAEAALLGQAPAAALARAAADCIASDLDPPDDPVLPGAQRRQIAAVLLRRLLSDLLQREAL